MRFWDSSAVVPLLVDEPISGVARALLHTDHDIAAAWTTEIECASALARLHREGRIDVDDLERRGADLARTAQRWMVAEPTDSLRRAALRAVRVHALRAADALQLAAATIFAEGHPPSLELVSLDDRLIAAARREGFPVIVPAAERR